VPENPNSRRLPIGVWLALWAVCTILSLGLWARPRTTPLEDDEIYWIGSSYYYDLAFVRHDWRSPDWQLLPARENPPVAKYLIGLGLATTGQHVASPDLLGCFYSMFASVPGAWGTGTDYAKRAAVVARMTPEFRDKLRNARQINLAPELLTPPRMAMIGCAVLASLLVFLFGRRALSGPAGLLASQGLLLHPVVVEAYNHALSDAVALIFSTAAAVVTFHWTSRFMASPPTGFTRGWCAVLGGVLLAFACGSKMNSLVIVALAGLSLAFVALRAWRQPDHGRIAQVLFFGGGLFATALAVFIAINPTILHDVAGGLAATVTEHRQTETLQVQFMQAHLETLAQRIGAVATMTAFSQIAFSVLAIYAAWCLASVRLGVRFVAGWWLIAWVCVGVWIPFSRLRYVMPLIVPTVLLGAALLENVVMLAASRIRKTHVPAKSATGAS
jgi:hypothetical protein